jgi:hypothetical protein
MSTGKPKALLIVAVPNRLLPGEVAAKKRLEDLDYAVHVREATTRGLDVRDTTLVVVSSSVKDQALGDELRDMVVPIIASAKELYVRLGMCRSADVGHADNQSIEIIHPPNPGHPMTATLTGIVKISSKSEPMTLCWAQNLQDKTAPIAALPNTAALTTRPSFLRRWLSRLGGFLSFGKGKARGDAPAAAPRKTVLFGCRVATPMVVEGSQQARDFPAKRVAFPFDYRKEPTEELLRLFDEAANWAVGNINIRQFAEVFREEWKEIYTRRKGAYANSAGKDLTGFDGKNAPENLVGLAFSGGGIRSATFCLGVLQALHELKLLPIFDYFSTVSGGGYLGGWWSAWLSRPEDKDNNGIFPDAEKIEPTRLDSYRWRSKSTKVAEGSLSAGHDPIHHLRLFANYLTPRTGSFSGDTWRAITTLTRNLLLTWLMLLPLLLTFVVAAQSLLMLYQETGFLHTHWIESQEIMRNRDQAASSLTDPDQLQKLNHEAETKLEQHRTEYRQILGRRAVFIGAILLPLVGWIALMFMAFMRSNAGVPLLVKLKDWWSSADGNFKWQYEGRALAHLVGAIGVAAIVSLVLCLVWPPGTEFWENLSWLDPRTSLWGKGLIAWLIAGAGLLLFTLPWRRLDEHAGDAKAEEELRVGVWRNKIMSLHATLLVTLFSLAVLLVFASYGHEMFDYLWRDPQPRNQLLGYVAKIGGWGALVAAIFGTIFTALKSAPSGGHDSGEVEEPPAWHKVIFVLTPPLVMITLMVMAAWVAHEIFRALDKPDLWPLSAIVMAGACLSLFFALFEVRWQTKWVHLLLLAIGSLIIFGAASLYMWLPRRFTLPGHVTLLFIAAAVGSVLVLRLALKGNRWTGGWRRLEVRLLNKKPGKEDKKPHDTGKEDKKPHDKGKDTQTGARWIARIALIALALVPIGVWWFFAVQLSPSPDNRTGLTLAGLTGVTLCLFFIFIEAIFGKGDNRASLILLTSVYLVSVLLLLMSFHSTADTKLSFICLGFFATTITWVIAFGWMADPNAISMHGFYKGRLVRAYLGASNPKRFEKLYEITETVVGDDLLLTDMKNCERSAPYHLLNTTLNLTGGRDLATAQRSSAMFVLSKLYCGSFRTGFQRSRRYANGSLSLGMAVATSGAAVSPGMGAGKTTSSQAVLMTLLNLRLGFWAPTPGGEHWESRQARLWPFHTLREFLSQTNDLSSYCYLTDGGHFDNLGIYSLVERGCGTLWLWMPWLIPNRVLVIWVTRLGAAA